MSINELGLNYLYLADSNNKDLALSPLMGMFPIM